MIQVALVDDHPVVRSGIRNLLERQPDIRVIFESGSGQEALSSVAESRPDVLVLDMELPDLNGVEVARRLREQGSPAKVLALSAYDDEGYVRELLASGAAGYLTKDEALEKIVEAVRGVAAGEQGWLSRRAAARVSEMLRGDRRAAQLTPREQEVLELLAQGWSNDRIGAALSISERTVRFHLSNAYQKLGVSTRAEAIALLARQS